MIRFGLLRSWRIALGLIGLCLLAACGFMVDAEQARVCRIALPALNPGARVTVRRVQTGPSDRTVLIAYTAEHPGRPVQEREVVCAFAAEGLSPNNAELTGIVTERGPVSCASLYFLKHYYIDTPEGVSGDPCSRVDAAVMEIPAGAAYSLQ